MSTLNNGYFLVTFTTCLRLVRLQSSQVLISLGDDTNATMHIKDMLGSKGFRNRTVAILGGSLIPHNGRIHTMDKDSRVGNVLGVREGRLDCLRRP